MLQSTAKISTNTTYIKRNIPINQPWNSRTVPIHLVTLGIYNTLLTRINLTSCTWSNVHWQKTRKHPSHLFFAHTQQSGPPSYSTHARSLPPCLDSLKAPPRFLLFFAVEKKHHSIFLVSRYPKLTKLLCCLAASFSVLFSCLLFESASSN